MKEQKRPLRIINSVAPIRICDNPRFLTPVVHTFTFHLCQLKAKRRQVQPTG